LDLWTRDSVPDKQTVKHACDVIESDTVEQKMTQAQSLISNLTDCETTPTQTWPPVNIVHHPELVTMALKIGFLGGGKMAQALANGFLAKGKTAIRKLDF